MSLLADLTWASPVIRHQVQIVTAKEAGGLATIL